MSSRRAFHPSSSKSSATPAINAAKKGRWVPIISRTAVVALTGTLLYDGFNDFEMCGGFGRFVRSLKIAVVVSADYMYSLYGLDEDSKEYNEVKSKHKNLLRHILVKI